MRPGRIPREVGRERELNGLKMRVAYSRMVLGVDMGRVIWGILCKVQEIRICR